MINETTRLDESFVTDFLEIWHNALKSLNFSI